MKINRLLPPLVSKRFGDNMSVTLLFAFLASVVRAKIRHLRYHSSAYTDFSVKKKTARST